MFIFSLWGLTPEYSACMYWLISIKIEKHGEEGKQELKSEWLIQSSQDVCEDLSE